MSLYTLLRPGLFLLPPERAHRAAICTLQKGLGPRSSFSDPALNVDVAGLNFANPIGLSAGFDKNAECYAGALAAGFGHVEIGTVTPRAQLGNPTPRIFRVVEHQAVINRLGFNNAGVDAAVRKFLHDHAQVRLWLLQPGEDDALTALSLVDGGLTELDAELDDGQQHAVFCLRCTCVELL